MSPFRILLELRMMEVVVATGDEHIKMFSVNLSIWNLASYIVIVQ